MSLKAGIVGLPNVGKSTLFNAITNSHVLAENYPFATINPNTGVVIVPDERLDFLTAMFKPKRKINATFDFYDIAGLVKGASKGEGLGNQFLAAIRECDAIVEVVRCFDSSSVIRYHEDPVDPSADIDVINLELSMSDLDAINNRIGKQDIRARVAHDKTAQYEMPILTSLKTCLEQGIPARLAKGLSSEQMDYARRNFFLLTTKPMLYVANVADGDYSDLDGCAFYQIVKKIAEAENAVCIPLSCQIEFEISQLPSGQDRQDFLETLGATESGLDKLVKASYRLLNLSTFFTCGTDECRAWTFKNGMLAPECAGIIHTDFQKGFIKAEVYDFDDLKKCGSELAVKEAGKLRSEGKDYPMKDGDIVFFRFNVTK
jgi:ribosome-binding ATPase